MAVARRSTVAALVFVVAGLVGATPSVAGAAAPAAASTSGVRLGPSSVRWHACDDMDLQLSGARCATLRVPLDYAHPAAGTVELALARVRHTVPARRFQGIMLTNPGGPGGSGRYLATLGSSVPGGAGRAYDWIGFDPRGVGASRPAISCDDAYFRLNRPSYSTPAARKAWLARSKAYATACARKNGPILRHMTTIDSARDMDRIRRALGATRLNYYGFSYGTYLGQVYATLYPGRVRRMVLDSNVDPRRVWYRANLDQDVAFQRTITAWFGWVAAHNATFHLGRSRAAVASRWYAIRRHLVSRPDHGVGPDEWTDAFLDAAYYQSSWVDEGWLFADYVHHHAVYAVKSAYFAGTGFGDDNSFAVYTAVQCTDVPWPRSWRTWLRDNARVGRMAPFETWGNAWFNAPCLFWPAPAHRPVRVDGRRVGGALLVGETLDAATPFSGSLAVRRLFPRARLIALPGGTSHANSLAGDACLDNRIAAYLVRGALPARRPGDRADATCAPLPAPRP